MRVVVLSSLHVGTIAEQSNPLQTITSPQTKDCCIITNRAECKLNVGVGGRQTDVQCHRLKPLSSHYVKRVLIIHNVVVVVVVIY